MLTKAVPTGARGGAPDTFTQPLPLSWGWRISGRPSTWASDFPSRVRQSLDLDALNLRLIPNPATAVPRPDDPTLGAYRKNTAYCIATQAGIWDREFLAELAGRTAIIWEFERRGSYSFEDEDGRPILCTLSKEFPFVDAVHKGYWEPSGLRLCRENGVAVDREIRNAPPILVVFREWVKGVVFRLSPGLIVRIQNRLDLGWKEAKQKS